MIDDGRAVDVLNEEEILIKNGVDEKVHPWRRCSKGMHFVKEHEVHVPPSKKHPEGQITKVKSHCASNPSHMDELSYDEIRYISDTYFDKLAGPPAVDKLTVLFKNADHYDKEIRGWVQYWNDIFQLSDLLDANFIKALIGTESGFRLNPPENPHAHGLIKSYIILFLFCKTQKANCMII